MTLTWFVHVLALFLIKEEEKNLSNLSGCPKWLSKSLKVQLQMGIENSKKKFVYFRMEKKKKGEFPEMEIILVFKQTTGIMSQITELL